MKPQIFISYRRETGRSIARNISDRLTFKGYNVFFDYTSMRNGKFNEQIYDAIECVDDFVLVLSKGSMDRCVNADDWVRCEILHALAHNRNIILVQDEDFTEFPSFFPEELSVIKDIDFTPISNKYYDAFIEMLEKRLKCYRITLNENNSNSDNMQMSLDYKASCFYKLGSYIYMYNFSLMVDSNENLISAYDNISTLTEQLSLNNIFDNPNILDVNKIKAKNWISVIEDYFEQIKKEQGAEFGSILEIGHHSNMIGTFCIYDLNGSNQGIQSSKLSVYNKCKMLSRSVAIPLSDIDLFMKPIKKDDLSTTLNRIMLFFENYSQNVKSCTACMRRNGLNVNNCIYCGAKLL